MEDDRERALLEKLNDAVNAFGRFAPSPSGDPALKASTMKSTLETLEETTAEDTTSIVEYNLGLAFRNYTAWYVRGSERKEYLEKVVVHLDRALSLDPRNTQAKVDLAQVLLDEKQVRDLDKGLKLAVQLRSTGSLPDWLDPTVQRAVRWKREAVIPKDNNFSKLNATPASLKEERTRLRKLLASSLQGDDPATARTIALRLYNLALLVAYLYGDYDGGPGVTGGLFDAAKKKMKQVARKMNFDYLGRIEETKFLSPDDYARIEKVMGEKTTSVWIDEIEEMLLQPPAQA